MQFENPEMDVFSKSTATGRSKGNFNFSYAAL